MCIRDRGDITLEELCRKGLAEWCQKLADLQISGTGYSRLDGAILCPISADQLVFDKMCIRDRITASNTEDGACFAFCLPLGG